MDETLVPTGSKRNFGTSYSVDFGEVIVSSLEGGVLSRGSTAADNGFAQALPGLMGGILNDYFLEADWDRKPGPTRRLAVCAEGVPLFGSLRVRDGRLTYAARPGTKRQ